MKSPFLDLLIEARKDCEVPETVEAAMWKLHAGEGLSLEEMSALEVFSVEFSTKRGITAADIRKISDVVDSFSLEELMTLRSAFYSKEAIR